jgi:hypothetical protein
MLAGRFWRIKFCEQFGYDGFAVESLALPERFEALGDFRMNLVLAEPTPLRQVPLDRLADQLPRRAVFFLCRCLYLRKQAGRNEGVARGRGFHEMQDSNLTLRFKGINDFKTRTAVWIDLVYGRRPPRGIALDVDSPTVCVQPVRRPGARALPPGNVPGAPRCSFEFMPVEGRVYFMRKADAGP